MHITVGDIQVGLILIIVLNLRISSRNIFTYYDHCPASFSINIKVPLDSKVTDLIIIITYYRIIIL